MVIRHINSFFHRHSRWLFGLFTVIIAFAFMDFMNPGRSGGCAFGSGPEIGTVFGRKITSKELAEMRSEYALFMEMMYGFNVREPKVQDLFGMIARIEAAKQRGVSVSDAQIAAAIQAMPQFRKDGKFDLERFNSFLAVAEKQGYSRAEIDKAVSSFLLIDMLDRELADGVIVSDGELAVFHNLMNEKFLVRRAQFKAADAKGSVALDAAKVTEFFNGRRDAYRIPTQAKALVAVFPYSDYSAAAEKAATPEALQRFYESNSPLFMKTDKDKAPVLPPFKDVEKSVREKFLAETATKLAVEAAQNFGRTVYEENEENVSDTFQKVAARTKVRTAATGVVKATDGRIGGLEEPALVQALFRHIDTVPVSDAVAGAKAAYVAAAFDIVPERRAELKEVLKQVQDDYVDSEALAAARANARKVREKYALLTAPELKKAVAADKQFAAVPVFSMAAPGTETIDMITVGAAEATATGKLSETVELPDGALLLYVESRTAAETPKEFDPLLRGRYRALKGEGARQQFLRYLNSNCTIDPQYQNESR